MLARAGSPVAVAGARPKLVLHFDINETIMMGDPVAGVDFAAALNNIIAKFAFVRRVDDGPEPEGDNWGARPTGAKYQWHGSPFDLADRTEGSEPPPLASTFERPPGLKTYYELFRRDAQIPASRLTDAGLPGAIYQPVRDELSSRLAWPHAPHAALAPHGRHFLLPALFHCVCELGRRGRDFTVVFRTFGTYLPEVSRCWNAFSSGQHPDFGPEAAGGADLLHRFSLCAEDCARWVLWHPARGNLHSDLVLRQYDDNVIAQGGLLDPTATGLQVQDELVDEEAVVDRIAAGSCFALRDDYRFWKEHVYRPEAGKPVWLTADDPSQHHIFFDDNIHDKADDSIVAVRARASAADPYRSLNGEGVRRLQGVCLVKAQACDAIRDVEYFVRHVDRCEETMQRMREDGSLAELLASYSAPSEG